MAMILRGVYLWFVYLNKIKAKQKQAMLYESQQKETNPESKLQLITYLNEQHRI